MRSPDDLVWVRFPRRSAVGRGLDTGEHIHWRRFNNVLVSSPNILTNGCGSLLDEGRCNQL